jgi:hypothetical protein
MTYTFKLARRMARFRAVALVAALLGTAACSDRLDPSSPAEVPGDATINPVALDSTAAPAALSFYTGATAPGISFGAFDMSTGMLNTSGFTGVVKASGPTDIIGTLDAARKVGARVVVRMSGSNSYFQNSDGTLSLTKWKAQIARFKYVNLAPYIKDGTLMGHYLVDEPHDVNDWGGKPVPFATLEAMAKYSKELWPTLATMVRAYPDWLANASFHWYYLDAAWAQYSARKGEVTGWMSNQAYYAKNEGLALVVGLNLLNGGNSSSGIRGETSGSYAMSASQIKSWGSVLATHPLACAVLSWKYSSTYFSRSDVKAALTYVADKAKNRSTKSCTPSKSLGISEPGLNSAPKAFFGSSCTRLACKLTDRSTDAEGNSTIVKWSWAYGDGSTFTTSDPATRSPSHTYKAGGTYKPTLTVTDKNGATGSILHTITVTP